MPIYEFKCDACAHRFEALCRMGSNGRGLACPRCSRRRLRRLVSTFAARSGGAKGGASSGASSACASCSGGNCATCH